MTDLRQYRDILEVREMAVDIDEHFGDGDIDVLYEGGNSKAWAKTPSFLIFSKVNSIGSKIKGESDVSKKIDLLADQNRFIAAFINLSVAATIDDKGAYKKGK